LGRIRPHLPAPSEDLLPGLGAATPGRAVAELPAQLSSDLYPPGPVASLRLCELWRRGAFRLPGGRDGLRKLLDGRCQTHSGEVTQVGVSELSVKRGRVVGVVTQPRGEVLGCGFVVASMPTARLVALLGEQAPRRLSATAQAMPPKAWRFVHNLVLAAEGGPEGLAEHPFIASDLARPPQGEDPPGLHPGEAPQAARAGPPGAAPGGSAAPPAP